MSKIEVNAIEPQCGTTLTIGASDTSIAGIGTVNWDTTAKTAAFTAVSGRGYFVNTTSAAITVTLPASPSSGDIVAVSDYAKTADANNITIGRNGSNIEGSATDLVIDAEGVAMTFIYVDATKGWKVIDTGQESDKTSPSYIVATGGTITTCGNFKIHTFTGPGTFCVSQAGNSCGSNTVDYMVIAGGGAGGTGNNAGGGGAGGYRESSGAASGCYSASPLGSCVSALPVTATGYPVTVGAGGAQKPASPGTDARGTKGSNSIFSTITSTGGGGGAVGTGSSNGTPGTDDVGEPGGSGGGGGYYSYCCATSPGGTGNTPPVTPAQGKNGGNGSGLLSPAYGGGGGGGASAAGCAGTGSAGGTGGNGTPSEISGSANTRAGGGGGGSNATRGSGGSGGGGCGAACGPVTAVAGTTNTGSGGGGGANPVASPTTTCETGGAGGSGIVIIRYKFQN
jgi:hypothetical protein